MSRILATTDINGNIPTLYKGKERIIKTTLTSNNPYLYFDTEGYSSFSVTVHSPSANPALLVTSSNDNINYNSEVQMTATSSYGIGMKGSFISANGTETYVSNKVGRFVRIYLSSINQCYISVSLSNSTVKDTKNDISVSLDRAWSYSAPSGGITNTTPVLLTTTAISGSFIYGITSLDLCNNGSAGTEVIIRSVTVGTVIYRTYLRAGQNISVNLTPMIKALKSNSLELLLSSGVNVEVYPNVRGIVTIA